MDAVSEQEAADYSEKAIQDSRTATGLVEATPYTVCQLVYAHLIAANCCKDTDQQEHDNHPAMAAKEATESNPWSDHSEVISAQYHLLQQSGKEYEMIVA